MSTSCWGVVVAAGRGERLGGAVPKALIELAGRPLVVHAVRALLEGGCDGVVVAAPPDLVSTVEVLLTEPDLALDGSLPELAFIVVRGGTSRQASVSAALTAVPAQTRWVLIHDAARPLVPGEVVRAVRTALAEGALAVVPVVAVVDTIKAVDAQGQITGTIDRSGLRRTQTPQGFDRDLLVRALDKCARSGHEVTDDAEAVAALGVPVQSVPGDERSLKITTPADLVTAEALLRQGAG